MGDLSDAGADVARDRMRTTREERILAIINDRSLSYRETLGLIGGLVKDLGLRTVMWAPDDDLVADHDEVIEELQSMRDYIDDRVQCGKAKRGEG